MMTSIEKRNGEIVFFDRSKIEQAVFKALIVTHPQRSRSSLKKLSEVVTDYVVEGIGHKGFEGGVPKVEEIQDIVENTLMSIGEHDTARTYIKYRYEHKKIREERQSVKDILNMFDD